MRRASALGRRLSRGRGLRWVLLAVAFFGFSISLYLTFTHYRGTVLNCYVFSGCDVVQGSRYSAILGVPLALLGTVFFVVMFYLGIGLLIAPGRRLVLTYKLFAYAGALAVIPLFLLQAVVLRAYCSYCLAAEALMLALWVGSFALTAFVQTEAPAPIAMKGPATGSEPARNGKNVTRATDSPRRSARRKKGGRA